MERTIWAVCVALGVAVAVGAWPNGRETGATEGLQDAALVEVTMREPGHLRARPPWLGPAAAAGRARSRMGEDSSEPAAPRGPRAWLLGRRASIGQLRPEDWESLPGVGPSLAARIGDRVRRDGPLRSLAQLDEVRGIGPTRLRALGRWLTDDSLGHAVAPRLPSR